jgi:hypothetical protein
MTYSEIKKMHPELKSCFFAFNEQQLQEGIKEHNLEGQKLYQGAHGLIGTKEGIANYLTFYEKREERIRTECNPKMCIITNTGIMSATMLAMMKRR